LVQPVEDGDREGPELQEEPKLEVEDGEELVSLAFRVENELVSLASRVVELVSLASRVEDELVSLASKVEEGEEGGEGLVSLASKVEDEPELQLEIEAEVEDGLVSLVS